MLLFVVAITTFGEFFTGSYTSATGKTKIYSVTSNSCFISQCRFSDLLDKAIICSISSSKLVIGDCIFYQVSSPTHAGVVLFDSLNGECAVKRICCYGCITTSANSFGSFLYANQHTKCLIIETSIARSFVESPQPEQSAVFFFTSGRNHIMNANISNTKLSSYVIGLIVGTTECTYNYSTLFNNIASNAAIIEVQYVNSAMHKDNFVNNTIYNLAYWVFSQYGGGVMSFIQSIILDCASTTDQVILSSTDFFFYQCRINKGYIPPEIRTGIVFSTTSTYMFTHFASHFCLTPHIPTPTKQPESLPFLKVPNIAHKAMLAMLLALNS